MVSRYDKIYKEVANRIGLGEDESHGSLESERDDIDIFADIDRDVQTEGDREATNNDSTERTIGQENTAEEDERLINEIAKLVLKDINKKQRKEERVDSDIHLRPGNIENLNSYESQPSDTDFRVNNEFIFNNPTNTPMGPPGAPMRSLNPTAPAFPQGNTNLDLQSAFQLVQTIETYNGSKDRKLNNFKQEFESIAPFLDPNSVHTLNTGSKTLANYIKLRLRGDALNYVESLPQSHLLTDKDLWRKLQERFTVKKDRLYFQDRLNNLSQGKLTVEALAQKTLKLAAGLINNSTELQGIEKDTRIRMIAEDAIYSAFNSDIFNKLVEYRTPHEFNTLVEAARDIENMLNTQQIKSKQASDNNHHNQRVNTISTGRNYNNYRQQTNRDSRQFTPPLRRQQRFYSDSRSNQNMRSNNYYPNTTLYNNPRQSRGGRGRRFESRYYNQDNGFRGRNPQNNNRVMRGSMQQRGSNWRQFRGGANNFENQRNNYPQNYTRQRFNNQNNQNNFNNNNNQRNNNNHQRQNMSNERRTTRNENQGRNNQNTNNSNNTNRPNQPQSQPVQNQQSQ